MDEKNNREIPAYTDFPFISLGDEFGGDAPTREIKMISYDGKYVGVTLPNGRVAFLCKDHCYRAPGTYDRAARFKQIELQSLPKWPGSDG